MAVRLGVESEMERKGSIGEVQLVAAREKERASTARGERWGV